MRDYSFGNFISALRERSGLSQYQLGALVGVSDKAVSKWENGVSKPRMDTVKKIADVLNISVGELLACEYDAFEEKRKDLFAMKKEIIKMAKDKMLELYGTTLPVRIMNRFKTEEAMLSGQDILLWMGFLGNLKRGCYQDHTYFAVRGAQFGASLISWLLGATDVNPLPAHYYCPKCKKIEFVSWEKCGLDMVDRNCSCGHIYYKDGFDIDAMNMYPFSNSYEITVAANTTAIVVDHMKDYFNGCGVMKELEISYTDPEITQFSTTCKNTKYVLLSHESSKKYSQPVIILQPEEAYTFCQENPCITIIETSETSVQNQKPVNEKSTQNQVRAYVEQVFKSGKLKNDSYAINLSSAVNKLSNPKFSDLIAACGLLYSAGAWDNNGEIWFDRGISLDELIYCREDLYRYLYQNLKKKCCDDPAGLAFEIKEQVRKGIYSHKGMPEQIEKLLLECDVPEWYIESMKKIHYLFPKTHLITMIKHNVW